MVCEFYLKKVVLKSYTDSLFLLLVKLTYKEELAGETKARCPEQAVLGPGGGDADGFLGVQRKTREEVLGLVP